MTPCLVKSPRMQALALARQSYGGSFSIVGLAIRRVMTPMHWDTESDTGGLELPPGYPRSSAPRKLSIDVGTPFTRGK